MKRNKVLIWLFAVVFATAGWTIERQEALFTNEVELDHTLKVNGNTTLGDSTADTITISGAATLSGANTISGATALSGFLTQTGGEYTLTETVAATNVLTAAECGKTMYLSHATEFATTLPAMSTVSAGCEFEFIVAAAPAAASYTVLTGNSLENLLIGGINELEVDTADDGPYDADGDTITFADGVAVVGDFVKLRTDGTSWFLYGQANADGGITVTKAD